VRIRPRGARLKGAARAPIRAEARTAPSRVERRALWLAEDAARELPNVSLQDALQLVNLLQPACNPTR